MNVLTIRKTCSVLKRKWRLNQILFSQKKKTLFKCQSILYCSANWGHCKSVESRPVDYIYIAWSWIKKKNSSGRGTRDRLGPLQYVSFECVCNCISYADNNDNKSQPEKLNQAFAWAYVLIRACAEFKLFCFFYFGVIYHADFNFRKELISNKLEFSLKAFSSYGIWIMKPFPMN